MYYQAWLNLIVELCKKKMIGLLIFTGTSVLVSFIIDKAKTLKALDKGMRMFFSLLPTLLGLLSAISIVLYFVPNEILIEYMGQGSGAKGWFMSALIGSVALIPGFVAFPLSNMLMQNGVAASNIAVFITTLAMVGVISLPVEARYFGWRISLLRNAVSFAAALAVGLIMAVFL
jgi:uncharacterized membrane protein YraQ (UPF0718 family)